MIVGLLHTVPALAGTFESDLTALDPRLRPVHIADASLLETAVREGVTDAVRQRVADHLSRLADAGARAILVTCSSIGEAVDEAAATIGVPVVRIDRAMAREAVRLASAGASGAASARIVVLATLDATLGPTGRLIAREVESAGARVTVDSIVVAGAIEARTTGRPHEHDRLIREAAAGAADAAVVVLAQASMARAIENDRGAVPVLTSPASGMAALLDAVDGEE
jgi:aspartate/glutamate racemase